MGDLQVFKNENFGSVRAVESNGDVWFVARDVCDILEIKNVSDALERLDKDEKNTIVISEGIRGNPNMSVINESGVYALVFTSRKPEAKVFKKWVTSEVLPAIRKTGKYEIPKTLEERSLEMMAELSARVMEQKKQIAELVPKAEFYDAVADTTDTKSIREVAGMLAIPRLGQNNLFAFLRNMGVLDRQNIPYRQYIERGFFKLIEQTPYMDKSGEMHVPTKTVVLQQGIDFIRKLAEGGDDEER
jgi:prophage antirepressor-like protein